MRGRRTIVAAALLLLTAFTVQTANASVLIKGVDTASGFRWKPHAVSVAAGTRVVWRAVTGSHTVTAYRGRWNKDVTLTQGEKTSFTFRAAGVYRFRCLFHSTLVNGVCSGMCGKVTVG